MVLVSIVDGGYPRLKIDLNCVVNDVPTIELLPVHHLRDIVHEPEGQILAIGTMLGD